VDCSAAGRTGGIIPAKIFANRAFHALAMLLFGRRIRDVTNNLKIMRREVVLDLQLREPGLAVNA
jgi:dolichol-phosphate mannosyltransferase